VKQGSCDEVIRRDVLREIYDMDVRIQTIARQKVCIYYQ